MGYLTGDLTQCKYVEQVLPVETNIVLFELNTEFSTDAFLSHLTNHNIKAFATGTQLIRFVTHLDITDEMIGVIENGLLGY